MLHTSSSHSSRTPLLSRQELALIAVTMVWGGTFLVVHLAMQQSGPLFFVGLRFVTAGLIGLLVFRKVMAGLTRTELVAGTAIGASIFLGYGLQTFGLQTISSSKSAFLTALYVPIVPLLQWLVMGKPPRLMSWIGIGLAFTGLMLVAGPESGGMELNVGEMATMLSTLAIAAEVLLIGHFAGKVDARRVTTVQLLAAGTMALLAMPVAGESVPDFSWIWLTAAVAMACASILIQLTMNWAQKSLSPTRATVIYASEPVWAGIVGRMAGDRLPGLAILGAVLIVGGVLVSELRLGRQATER
ncbi:DMT family transporter [Delftia lacustris]|uniref:Permease of the drug/metabolite transporter (DMT) superfamily n=1 Tax=Delftia lacustris TaxID=558537 RepID=A0A1H3TLJ2_9BURK|nr:DMT family transporter [Delftia lacustris]SDZ50980.1 Permease of the drug/metabolite transporter (DMT) superfamily [Delftia lacustris]